MAVLNAAQRQEVFEEVMQRINHEVARGTQLTKAQWRAVLEAADDFIDANAATYNSTIPQPARSLATSQEKAFALVVVLKKRFLVGV